MLQSHFRQVFVVEKSIAVIILVRLGLSGEFTIHDFSKFISRLGISITEGQ
jgi:hypothetical protein